MKSRRTAWKRTIKWKYAEGWKKLEKGQGLSLNDVAIFSMAL